MKKLIAIVLAVMLLTMGAGVALANPAVTVYANDRPGWESAVCGVYEEEFFTDATLNPGVSVVSTVGYVHSAGYWWDRVDDGDWYGDGIVRDTTWSFAAPIMAWGGTFDAAGPGGPGSSIKVELIDGTPVDVGIIPNTTAGTFWGFVSDQPFVKVHLKDAALIAGACETYTMDDMVYSFEPIEIDIKPGSDPNSINLKSKGVIPVAILTTPTFDATTVDGTTVMFATAPPVHDMSDPLVVADHQHDVDLDGDIDFVFHFAVQETDIVSDDPSAMLTGNTLGGIPIWGTDSVRTLH